MAETKKRGRSGAPRGDRAVTVNLTLRLPPKLLEALRQSAKANERSIASEAQLRLAQGEINEVAKVVALVTSAVEEKCGKSWSADQETKLHCRTAIGAALDLVFGCEDHISAINNNINFFRDVIEKARDQNTKSNALEYFRKQFEKIEVSLEMRGLVIEVMTEYLANERPSA